MSSFYVFNIGLYRNYKLAAYSSSYRRSLGYPQKLEQFLCHGSLGGYPQEGSAMYCLYSNSCKWNTHMYVLLIPIPVIGVIHQETLPQTVHERSLSTCHLHHPRTSKTSTRSELLSCGTEESSKAAIGLLSFATSKTEILSAKALVSYDKKKAMLSRLLSTFPDTSESLVGAGEQVWVCSFDFFPVAASVDLDLASEDEPDFFFDCLSPFALVLSPEYTKMLYQYN